MKTVKVVWRFKRNTGIRSMNYNISYSDDKLRTINGCFTFRRTHVQ